jgi:hypothetical protein
VTAETTSHAPRTYGNWRRPASAGLGALGTLGTVVLLVGLVAVIGTLAAGGLLLATGTAAVLGLVLVASTVRDRHHRSGIQRVTTRLRWARARRAGANVYRSGPVGRVPGGSFRLPGLAAASTVSEWWDTAGRSFALIVHPATHHATVVLVTEPEGGSLVDDEQIDLWVARWGSWLASLGHEPGLVAASVTVETAPDYGVRVQSEVQSHLAQQAPELARAMLTDVARTAALGSATVAAYVALTFSTAGRTGGRRRSVDDLVR